MFTFIKSFNLKKTVSLDKKLKQSAQEDDEYLQFISNVTDTYERIERARSCKDVFRELVLYYQYEKLLAEGQSVLVNTFQKWQDSKMYDHVPEAEEFYIKALNISYLPTNLRHFVNPSKYSYSYAPKDKVIRDVVFRPTQQKFICRNSPKFTDNYPNYKKNTILSKKYSFTYVQKNMWCELFSFTEGNVYLIADPRRSHLKPDFIFYRNAYTKYKWHCQRETSKYADYRIEYSTFITTIANIKDYQQQEIFASASKMPRMNEVMPSISPASILCFAAEKDDKKSLEQTIFANYFYRSCLSDTYPQFNELWQNFPPLYILNPTPQKDASGLQKFTEAEILSFLKTYPVNHNMLVLFHTHPQIFSNKISHHLKKISLDSKTIHSNIIKPPETEALQEDKSITIQKDFIFNLALDFLANLDLASRLEEKKHPDQYEKQWMTMIKKSKELYNAVNDTKLPPNYTEALSVFKCEAWAVYHHKIPNKIKIKNIQLITSDAIKTAVLEAFNSYIQENKTDNNTYRDTFLSISQTHGWRGKMNAKNFMEKISKMCDEGYSPNDIYKVVHNHIKNGPGNFNRTSFKTFLKNELFKLTWDEPALLKDALSCHDNHSLLVNIPGHVYFY